MPFETRSEKRHPIQVTAEFCIHESMTSTVKLNVPVKCVKAPLLDISATGCSLDSPYLIPPDTLLKIDIDTASFAAELKIERPLPVVVTGNVRSCAMKAAGHYRLGIYFAEIKKEDAELILNFIKAMERRQSPRWDMSQG